MRVPGSTDAEVGRVRRGTGVGEDRRAQPLGVRFEQRPTMASASPGPPVMSAASVPWPADAADAEPEGLWPDGNTS